MYFVYELILYDSNSNYPTLEICLFGQDKLTRGTDIHNYKYFRYGIGFDIKGFFSIGDEVGRNVIIFGVNIFSSPHTDNKGKDIFILGKDPTQGLCKHSLTAEKIYSVNFTVTKLVNISTNTQYTGILKQLLLMIVILYQGNLKDCLMKALSLLLHLIKFSILH